MAALDPIQVNRFVQLFPELPAECVEVVMLYAAGARIGDINLTRRQVEFKLHKAAGLLGLYSIQALRPVVITRLLLSIPFAQQ